MTFLDPSLATKQMLAKLAGETLKSLKSPAEGSWHFGFGKCGLHVECPWRLIVGRRITTGASDHGEQFGLPEPVDAIAEVLRVLDGKALKNVEIDSVTSDLRLTFDENTRLDAFNSSSGYEGWNYSDDSGVTIVALGGGKLAIWDKSPIG